MSFFTDCIHFSQFSNNQKKSYVWEAAVTVLYTYMYIVTDPPVKRLFLTYLLNTAMSEQVEINLFRWIKYSTHDSEVLCSQIL
jgi:hypothetical protein